jgi:NAD(P)-dependent dehydrogenase (short-subunit alcohol dehydrogenase family)
MLYRQVREERMKRLAGKTALITGAAAGIGRAAARLFAAEGASVALVDLDRKGLDETAAGLERALTLVADVTGAEENARIVAEAEKRFGGLDIALLNAGIEGPLVELAAYPPEAFEKVYAVNVRGVFLGLQAVIPAMRRRGGGSVVLTSSTSGVRALPGMCAYTMSKHAVIGLMRSAAVDLAPEKIRVNTVNPGPIETRMLADIQARMRPDAPGEADAAMQRGIPIKRKGRAEEVARMMLYLASDDASFCTGGVYMVDGGVSAGAARS